MKQIINSLLLAVALVLPLTAAAEIKIAVINTNYVFAKSPQKEAMTKKLKAEFTGKEASLKRSYEAIEKATADLRKNAATMSETQQTNAKRAIDKQKADFQLAQQAYKEDAARRGREEQEKIGNLVKKAVDDVARRNGYNMLIERQAAVYIDNTVPEISEQVLAELRK